MLFDYYKFKESLRDNPGKRHIIEKWEKFSKAECIEDEPFYPYLKRFKTIPYKRPLELEDEFDWALLQQLVSGSFSSEFELTFDEAEDFEPETETDLYPELCITVESNGDKVTKRISELYSFQILRLYEIYCEEQINLHALKMEDKNEEDLIEKDRYYKVRNHSQRIKNAEAIMIRRLCFLK